ncbi:MAG: adenine-specific methyltransferase EcoRI family protein [Selenomonadaceae bacterium]|nr:adenine-specific methyltransferase EcoRI family protein [Selenomonadaceae bacterium]
MAGNRNLNSAAKAKNDEFYTQKSDIENELKNYTHFFRDKIIFCNCDDPYESKFFQYFAEKFNFLGLKKLIATNFVGSPVFQTVLNFEGTPNQIPDFDKKKHAIKVEISEVPHDDEKGFSMSDLEFLLTNTKNILTQLNGDSKFPAGDFRSAECVELLQQADIVVTNPPFSLFREYVKQLFQFNKKFIIIGNQNAVTYKEIFSLIMQNKMWLGYGFKRDPIFRVPDYYEERATRFWIDEHGQKWRSFGNMHWFTNLDVKKRHEFLPLVFSYAEHPEKYPHYDNYDAIEVSKTAEIPKDYDGVMGVPITFLDKYNPEQFEILGIANSARWIGYECYTIIDGKKIYNRILIRRR